MTTTHHSGLASRSNLVRRKPKSTSEDYKPSLPRQILPKDGLSKNKELLVIEGKEPEKHKMEVANTPNEKRQFWQLVSCLGRAFMGLRVRRSRVCGKQYLEELRWE